MTTKKSFPWKRYIILFLVLPICGLIAYDCMLHQGFEKSITKHYLKETGALEHVTVVAKQLIKMSKQTNQWIQANGPGYYEQAAKFLLPYIELCGKLFLIVVNVFTRISEYWTEKQPMVLEFIESYAPGLLDKVLELVRNLIQFLTNCRHIAADYLATKVFIGELSPENLQKATLAAFNTSQNIAIRYYHWFNQIITNIEQS